METIKSFRTKIKEFWNEPESRDDVRAYLIGLFVGLGFTVAATTVWCCYLRQKAGASLPLLVYKNVFLLSLILTTPIGLAGCRLLWLFGSIRTRVERLWRIKSKEDRSELKKQRIEIGIQMKIIGATLAILGTVPTIFSQNISTWALGILTEWFQPDVVETLNTLLPREGVAIVLWGVFVFSYWYIVVERIVIIPLIEKQVELGCLDALVQ